MKRQDVQTVSINLARQSRRGCWTSFCFVMTMAVVFSDGPVNATKFVMTTLDDQILRCEWIASLEVREVEWVTDFEAEVAVSDVIEVVGAAPYVRNGVIRFRGKWIGSEFVLREHEPALGRGRRFLVFGRFEEDSVVALDTAPATYEVVSGGVLCPGGWVFGLGSSALACGRMVDFAFAPPSEATLLGLLHTRVAAAKVRSAMRQRPQSPGFVTPIRWREGR